MLFLTALSAVGAGAAQAATTPTSLPAASPPPASMPAPESLPADADDDDGADAGAGEAGAGDTGEEGTEAGAGGLTELEKILGGAGMEIAEEKKEEKPVRATFVGKARWWTGFDTAWENRREDVLETRLYLRAELDFRRGDFRAHVGVRYKWAFRTNRVGDPDHIRYDSDLRVTEAWVFHPLLGAELTFGMQILRFGAADLFSVTNYINPVDLTEGIATEELPQLPVLALKVRYHLAGFDFYAIVIPVHTAPRIDVIGSDYALLGPASIPDQPPDLGDQLESAIDNSVEPRFNRLILATELPDEGPGNVQFVGRVAGSHAGFDYGATYGYVFNQNPSFRIDPRLLSALALTESDNPLQQAFGLVLLSQLLGAAGEGQATLFRSYFAREHHITTDLVTNLGPFTVKAEAGVIPSRELPTGDLAAGTIGVESRTVLQGVIGADYTKGDDLLVTLELAYTDVRGDPIKGDISFFAADSLRLGALIRYSLLDGDLAIQVFGYFDFLRHDYLVAPNVRYALNDHLSATVGAAILGGPEDSLGGYFGENDLVYVEVEVAF